ncbi:MAG: hypothetical protein CUN49_02065 [Candidatus Thermofonsia Clade 1 bacterium]|uniref:Lipoprotein LpqB beta-propeller domain-containing protein n=1 Tax=Candidatus Thermofonsia Clade 1 bacterium TaxID=2364210 RepID=A0A2M8PHR4_9CHLR|nr:MAG: hypothetical protein CUN49_02065 [Candidatus Thermofonsia Clade 1 bacterium]RMF49666.1 MAG: hypothetical protein D6749_12555 [Chloroflexota bacterium]
MRRLLFAVLVLLLAACSSAPSVPSVPPPTQAALLSASGERLPSGTLILAKDGAQRALLPDGRTIELAEAQQNGRAAPNGALGVLLIPNDGAFDLALVDYSADPPAVRQVPEGRRLLNPMILWQPDSSGFAFYDLPPFVGVRGNLANLYYHSLSDARSRALLSTALNDARIAALAFSPNGLYLLYSLLNENSEALGAQSGTGYLLNLLGGQPIALPREALLGFSDWLGDSSGFLSVRTDLQTGRGYLVRYLLAQLAEPQRLTAESENVTLAASAPDGQQIAIVTRAADGTSTLSVLAPNQSARRELHRVPVGQGFSALVWSAPEALYFSVSSAEGDQTWRIAPSGGAPTRLAEGLLQQVVR